MKTFRSLDVRIYSVAALTALAALLLGLMMLQSSAQSKQAFGWVSHSQEIIINLDGVESRLTQAESRLRGYLMTRDTRYLAGFGEDVVDANRFSAKLTNLVSDNPVQHARAKRLAGLTAEKAHVMSAAEQRTLANPLGSLPNPKERLRGRILMTAVTRQVDAMRTEERQLLSRRTAQAQAEVAGLKELLLYGFPLIALLIGGIAWFVRISISRPLADLLNVVTRFGAGDRDARASTAARSIEFRRLASAYNEMADRLVMINDRQETRQQSVQVLSEMSQRLQAIQNDGELSEVLNCFLPQVMPELSGALYLHNHSRNMLIRTSCWGYPQASPETFQPTNCWGLRRGQSHSINRSSADLICAHAAGPARGRRGARTALHRRLHIRREPLPLGFVERERRSCASQRQPSFPPARAVDPRSAYQAV
jgi:CHASE3 domain sensor protein